MKAEHLRETIKHFEQKLETQLQEVIYTKKVINDLHREIGEPEPYQDGEMVVTRKKGIGVLRPDQFYGKPLATVVKEILEMKGEPSTVNDICDILSTGGYDFGSKDLTNARVGVGVSLSKNPAFHRLPDKKNYGLKEWYPEVKNKKTKTQKEESNENEESIE